MTKKKMRKMIFLGVLMFYIAALIFGFRAANGNVSSNFHRNFTERVFNGWNSLSGRYEQINEDRDTGMSGYTPGEHFAYYYSSCLSYCKYPYVMAVVDEELNITYIPKNYISVRMTNDEVFDIYIGLDDYITDETKKEMISFIRKMQRYGNGVRCYDVHKAELYYNGEKYIPVTVEIGSYIDRELVTKSFAFSDYEPNVVLKKRDNDVDSMEACFMELEMPFYHRDNFEKYEHRIQKYFELNKENFSTDGGGGSSGGNDCIYSMGFEMDGKGYELYSCGGYDIFPHALLSDSFYAAVVYLGILFLAAGLVFYNICMKVLKKSEKLEEAKTTFISAASHELKTPIAVIQNRCECLMENIAPEKKDSYLRSIYDEALRMDGIVTSLLTYNRITQLTNIEKERCNLSELVKQEVKDYTSFAEKSGAVFEGNIADDVYADCNVQLMKMAIDNYLSNAVRYAVGEKIVSVSLGKKEKGFILGVSNEAEESSADYAKEIWDEFSRADSSRQRQGTSIGMGLPICKKVFELHGFKGYCRYNEGKITFVIES